MSYFTNLFFRISARLKTIKFKLGAVVFKLMYGVRVGTGAHISLGAWVERNTGVDDNYFSIGANSKIKGNCFFGIRNGFLEIGRNVSINQGANFLIYGPVVIGNNTRIALNCTIVSFNHNIADDGKSVVERGNNFRGITIGENVWLGANVTVLDGVTIGDNSVIGAGSIVSKSIAPKTVAAGNPCRPIREIK